MKQTEIFALKQYLHEFPDCGKLNDVIDLIYDRDQRVIIQEPFLEYTPDFLVVAIKKTEYEIESQFFPFHELVTILDRDSVNEILLQILKRSPSNDELNKVCSFLDSDFSSLLYKKIGDAIKQLNIK